MPLSASLLFSPATNICAETNAQVTVPETRVASGYGGLCAGNKIIVDRKREVAQIKTETRIESQLRLRIAEVYGRCMRLHLALSCEVNAIDYNDIGLHGRQVVDAETGTEEGTEIMCAQVVLHIQRVGGLGRQIKILHVDRTTRKSAGNDGRFHAQAQ